MKTKTIISNLALDLKATHYYKIGNKAGVTNLYLNTIRNIIFCPSLWMLICYRVGQVFYKIKILYPFYLLLIWRPLTLITQMEIYPETEIGGGLVIPHFGQIFINPKVKIGKNCLLYNGVTIGCDFKNNGSPVIGDDVRIGTGAKIIGHITIGDGAKINANQVVSKNLTK
jgi:serine O-acetyltransferase